MVIPNQRHGSVGDSGMAPTTRPEKDEVRFQLRRDLKLVEYAIGWQRQLVVKDPVRLQYFLFPVVENSLVPLLRSPVSLSELKQAVDEKLGPEKMGVEQIREFLARLINDNLLVAERYGHGPALVAQRRFERRRDSIQQIAGILAVRFRGINPQKMLDVLAPLVVWVFNPFAMGMIILGFVAALLVAALNFEQVAACVAGAQNLQDPRTAIAILLAIGFVKVLHELGHAFACRSIGRDCHELGFMVLAFIPCLYCKRHGCLGGAQSLEKNAGFRGWDICRNADCYVMCPAVVVKSRGTNADVLVLNHYRMFRQHAVDQRKPPAQIRRLLHPFGLVADSQFALEGTAVVVQLDW